MACEPAKRRYASRVSSHGTANVQLKCGNTYGRVRAVTIGSNESKLTVDPRLDSVVSTDAFLQLHYASRIERESFLAQDALELQRALGVDRMALLVIKSQAGSWAVELHSLDREQGSLRSVGALQFSEAAGYEPRRIEKLVEKLSTTNAAGQRRSDAGPAPVRLTPPVQPTPDQQAIAATSGEAVATANGFPVLGVAAATVGVVGLAVSWALFVERRAYRLREWNEVDASVASGYAQRGVWTLATAAAGAAALSASLYLLAPEAEGVPALAWVLGGVGLAAVAVGLGFVIGDEHCGPEIVLPLREPCLSVRADSIFGLEIALTALPLITLPITYLVRTPTSPVSLSLGGSATAMSLTATVGPF
jgi:hypothetical protein